MILTRGKFLAHEVRFVSRLRLAPEQECWPFLRKSGTPFDWYAPFNVDQIHHKAHRVAHALWLGPVLPGLDVMHSCDYPACCNPAHLSLGTRLHNVQDMIEKRRHCFGEIHPNSRISDETVDEIRRRVTSGEMQKTMCEEFGISPGHVCQIVSGQKRKLATA